MVVGEEFPCRSCQTVLNENVFDSSLTMNSKFLDLSLFATLYIILFHLALHFLNGQFLL